MLTQRQAKILEEVCEQYIKRAFPVSSQFLKKERRFSYSPATIRAELYYLERQHYLLQPYICSGRIPTDKGYRFFVNKILAQNFQNLEKKLEKKIEKEIFLEICKLNDFLKLIQHFTKKISYFCSGLVLTYFPSQKIYWKEGWETIIKEPEFKNIQYWKEFLEAVSDFENNINQNKKKNNRFDWKEKIKVFIGKENPFTKKKEVSMIITKISFFKKSKGMIALFGPKRMDFKRNIGYLLVINKMLEKFLKI